jgi:type IV fimbrial biogenesis protein FimT
MVGLVVLCILAGLAAPSYRAVLASSRLTSASNDLVSAIAQTRSQAVRLGRRVTLCRTNGSAACATGAGSGWEKGWIIFVDADHSSTDPSLSSGDTLTFQGTGLSSDIVAVGNGSLANYFSFGADGGPRQMGGGLLMGTLRVCSGSDSLSDDARARDIKLSSTGRIAVERTAGISASCPAPT